MKMVLYGILIAAALLVPTRPLELGKLSPVEAIRIDKRGEVILIETDTGDSGRGRTVNQAIQDLQETTAGIVYLDTAEYLLIPEDELVLEEITPYLQGNARICQWDGDIKLEEAVKYLDVHVPKMKLKDYGMGGSVQILKEKNGSLYLQEKNIERREKSS